MTIMMEGIQAALSDLSGKLDEHRAYYESLRHEVYEHTIDALQVPLTAGAGTLDLPGQLSPPRGFLWEVHRLTLSGWSGGGTVTVLIDNLEPILPSGGFTTPVTVFFGKAQLLLKSGQRLVVNASGVGSGVVQINGSAICMEMKHQARYFLGGI